jgi:glycosyltransferase involved in cell wall biosynthesis
LSPEPTAKPSLALIITAHREGILTWPGFRSAAALARTARDSGYTVTVCAVLDGADTETTRLGQQAQEYGLVDQLVISTTGDPGQSRLAGLRATTSDLVAIMDADDLISANWLTAAADLWQSGDGRDVIHPEWRLFFGGYWGWQRFIPQTDPRWQLHQQAFVFGYSSAALARRELWSDCPYQPAAVGSGFGHEDWHWGLEVIAAGYRHTVAPDTIRFYRFRHDSICRQHDQNNALIHASAFFDLPKYRTITDIAEPIQTIQPAPTKLQSYLKRVRDTGHTFWQTITDPVNRRLRSVRRAGLIQHPGRNPVLIDLFIAASHLEPTLSNPWISPEQAPILPLEYRSGTTLRALPRLLNDWDRATAEAGGFVTHAIFVPWIMQSGADRVAAEYARAIRLSGGQPILILTERPLVEPGVLPTGLPVVDASHLHQLTYDDRLYCLARLLIQRQPEHIILINAVAAWEAVSRYPQAVATHTKIWSVGFMDDEAPDRRLISWTKLYIENFAPYLTGILTDANTYRLDLEKTFGLPSGLVTATYVPMPLMPGDHINHQTKRRVLWAGRFDRQKRPDRLAKLARRLPDIDFEVWGRGYLEDCTAITRELAGIPNVHLRGGYVTFGEVIAHDQYDAFVYTAQYDGLPVIILEAIAASLPIVTTNSGGIGEIIDDTTGWFVRQEDGPAAFLAALNDCLNQPAEAAARVERARERLLARHNMTAFLNTLREIGLLSTTKQKPNALDYIGG